MKTFSVFLFIAAGILVGFLIGFQSDRGRHLESAFKLANKFPMKEVCFKITTPPELVGKYCVIKVEDE